jgi:hypothetical protein
MLIVNTEKSHVCSGANIIILDHFPSPTVFQLPSPKCALHLFAPSTLHFTSHQRKSLSTTIIDIIPASFALSVHSTVVA